MPCTLDILRYTTDHVPCIPFMWLPGPSKKKLRPSGHACKLGLQSQSVTSGNKVGATVTATGCNCRAHNITYMFFYIQMYIYSYTGIYLTYSLHTYLYVCAYLHAYICRCTHTNTYVCVYIYIYMLMCIYIHMHICMNMWSMNVCIMSRTSADSGCCRPMRKKPVAYEPWSKLLV